MQDFDLDLEAAIDEIEYDEYDEEESDEIEAIVAQAVYSSLEGARDELASNVNNHELRTEILENSEITLESATRGYLNLSDDADEMLQMEEQGYPSFDIKAGLLRSPKAKVGPSGVRYINVPFKGNNRGFNPLLLGKRISARYFAERGGGVAESFKRVSENTSPASWIHPGIAPHAIFDGVARNAQADLYAQIQDIKQDYK